MSSFFSKFGVFFSARTCGAGQAVSSLTDLNKLEKVCRGFPLLNDQDKMFILGVAEGLVFAKEKTGGREYVWAADTKMIATGAEALAFGAVAIVGTYYRTAVLLLIKLRNIKTKRVF